MSTPALALPEQRRALAFAISFRDAFLPDPMHPPVRTRLSVEALGRRGFAAADGSYRFSVTGSPAAPPAVPSGSFAVTVRSPGGEYLAPEPLSVNLPRATSLPPVRDDFLILEMLWPTRRLHLPPGETAVSGSITQAGAPLPGLRVLLHESAMPLPDTPAAYTDAAGDFLYRFPFAAGAAATAATTLNVTVVDGVSVLPVTPASVVLAHGRTLLVSLTTP